MGEYNYKYKENNPEDAHEFIINYLNILLKETFDENKIFNFSLIFINITKDE